MLEINIFDTAFVVACRARQSNVCIADNSTYVFDKNFVIGFREKRAGTRLDINGVWIPTKPGTDAYDALQKANAEYWLLFYVKQNLPKYVHSISLTSSGTLDIWENAYVLVSDDRVYVALPDATGSVVTKGVTLPLSMRKDRDYIPITVMPEILEKFLGICEAADIDVIGLDAVEIIRRAYYGLAPTSQDQIPAYGYALVLLLQNRIIIK